MSRHVKAKMLEIAEKLSTVIRVYDEDLNAEEINDVANSIKSYSPDRELDEIRAKVKQGYIIEAAVIKRLGATKSKRIIYDLLYEDEYRIECKDIGRVSAGKNKGKPKTWLSNVRERLNTLNKYFMAVDYLVVGYHQRVEDHWVVNINYVAKCYKFRDYFFDSKYDKARYFNHEVAAKNGDAVVIRGLQDVEEMVQSD